MRGLVTLTGPSLSGKTTLMRRLQSESGFQELVSHTTRPIRSGEQNHIDYHFVTPDEFAAIPMAESVRYGDYQYGVAISSIEESMAEGQTPLVIVEPNGVRQLTEMAQKQRWKLLRVYVHVTPAIQRSRFAERMFQDSQSDWEIYRKRFNLMQAEQGWRTACPWDVIVECFDERSEKWVVPLLTSRIRHLALPELASLYGTMV